MESRIPVVQALDERDLLVRKIMSRTEKAQFVDMIRPKAAVTWERRMPREEFKAEAESALQQILDLAARYEKLNAAITLSNAVTLLDTSQGSMTVSCAIALRNRLKCSGPYGDLTDFEGRLTKKMLAQYNSARAYVRKKNDAALEKSTSARGKTYILQNKNGGAAVKTGMPQERGRGDQTGKSIAPASGTGENTGRNTQANRQENLLRLYDPLDIRRRAEEIQEKRDALLAELETKIKISNATTYITI